MNNNMNTLDISQTKEPELLETLLIVDGARQLMGAWAPRKEAGRDVKKAASMSTSQ